MWFMIVPFCYHGLETRSICLSRVFDTRVKATELEENEIFIFSLKTANEERILQKQAVSKIERHQLLKACYELIQGICELIR